MPGCYLSEIGINPQCVACNIFGGGMQAEYAIFMLDTFGREVVDRHIAARRLTRSFTTDELLGLIESYQARIYAQEART